MKMSDRTVLVVDDHADIRSLVSDYLKASNFSPVCAADGREALSVMERTQVDLVILDLNMPGCDGFEVCRQIRRDSAVPILVLSARTEDLDKILMLELGADDYLTKPFPPRELLARVKALLRRSRMPSYESKQTGPLVVDPEARTVSLEGEIVEVTPREYDLLKTLAYSPGKNFTREELLDRAWGPEYIGDLRRVDNYIHRLRSKLKREGRPDIIRSIWGVGYRLEM